MISVKHSGSFKKTEKFLREAPKTNHYALLRRFGRMGVQLLADATPVLTGETAVSWDFELSGRNNVYTITWTNSNAENGIPVAILIQYGHGTPSGAYVDGVDFINPAIRPVMDALCKDIWEEVTKL